ncbi:MAG: hypothetical protein K0M58_04610 [Thiobacillus sp.]|nr:hypothetical protein [Thiobacillus sp.]
MANPITKIILTAVDRTKAAFTSVQGGLASIGSSASALTGMLGNLFAGLSVVGFVGALKNAIDKMDEAYAAAQKIGTSTENFSALTYAAQQSNVPVEELEKSLLKLARGIDLAKEGSGPAADAFERMGIDPKKFTDPADALLVIADRFAEMPNGVNKASIAMALFGKSGADLIPLLNEGSAGINRMTDEAERFGAVIGDEAGAAADQFNDSIDKLKTAGAGLGISIANDMLPGLNEVARVMAEAAKQGGVTAAIFSALKLGATDFLSNTDLSGTYKLAEAQKQLNALRKDGFKDDHNRVVQLNQWIPKLQLLADAEKDMEEKRRKNSKDTSKELAENNKSEAKTFKESIDERISDAQRLQGALQSAFSQALGEEERYTKEANKLRTKASSIPAGDQTEESTRFDATMAAMKLERLKWNGDPDDIRDQADAVRELASRLEDQSYASWLVQQATLAEAKAAETAAASARERAEGLAEQMRANEGRLAEAKGAAEAIGKPVSLDIVPTEQTDAALGKLREIKNLIDFIKQAGPISANVSAPSGTDTTAEALRKAALQYGGRR